MQLDRRTVLRTSGVALVGSMAGCSGGSGPEGGSGNGTDGGAGTDTGTGSDGSGSGPTVALENTSFSPRELSVETDTTVTWLNEDGSGHDVTSTQFNDGAATWDYASGTLENGDQATYTFDSAGAYEYYCTIHGQSTMCGVVLVGGAEKAGSLPCGSGVSGGPY